MCIKQKEVHLQEEQKNLNKLLWKSNEVKILRSQKLNIYMKTGCQLVKNSNELF